MASRRAAPTGCTMRSSSSTGWTRLNLAGRRNGTDDPGRGRPRGDPAAEQALSVFDLSLPVTLVEVKARYKTLVKLHHPDANGGEQGKATKSG